MKTHWTWNACIQIYKHLDVRNAESRLNMTHQAELCPLRLCSALRWVESANWSAACSTSFWSVSYFILEASWITSASKTSRDSQYGLYSVDTCSNNNKNKFITCSLCSTEGKKRLRYNWMVYFSCSNKIYRVKSDFLPPLWKPEEHILQVSLNSLGQLVC